MPGDVCAHVKSNAVIFTGAERTLAVGPAESRVDAVKVAVMKAGGGLAGSVAASDASFRSATASTPCAMPERRCRAARRLGARAEVIAADDERGLAMVSPAGGTSGMIRQSRVAWPVGSGCTLGTTGSGNRDFP